MNSKELLVGLLKHYSPTESESSAVNYLTNEKAVVKSRMFPFRFYKAYEVLDELQVFKEKNFQVFDRKHTNLTKEERKKVESLEKKFKELIKKSYLESK